jgi:ubiquinone/menaquinone biosynthesis C-methylase UbiE
MVLMSVRETSFDDIADVYDELVAWAPCGRWVRDLIRRLEPYGLLRGMRVLDVGCGTGLSTIPWAEEGFRVIGVDCSAAMLERARAKRETKQLGIRFVQQDVRMLDLPETFDLAVCMHSGFDYLLSRRDLMRALKRLRAHLIDGGLLAFDKCLDEPGFYCTARDETRRIPSGTVTFKYRWYPTARLFEQRCIVKRNGAMGRMTEVVHYLRATSVEETAAAVRKAAFEMLEPPRTFTVADPGMAICRAV